jgi:AraC-like DNA-binding protein
MSELRRITSTQAEAGAPETDQANGSAVEPINAVEPLSTLLNSLSVPLETHYQRRRALHHVIWQLFEQGWSTAAIAQYVGMNIRTVQRDLNKPKHADPQRRMDYDKTLVSPYRTYILQRCIPGRRCTGLFKELQAQGYNGSERTLNRYLHRLFKGETTQEVAPPSLPPLPLIAAPQPVVGRSPLSANRATWLILRRSEPSSEEKHLEGVLKSSPQFAPVIELAQSFARLIRQHQADQFEAWLEQALHSNIPAFVNFAAGLKEDFEAVQAAMRLRVSNGQVEGQINRLKLLKRQMYGRASIELLTQRFLLAC